MSCVGVSKSSTETIPGAQVLGVGCVGGDGSRWEWNDIPEQGLRTY